MAKFKKVNFVNIKYAIPMKQKIICKGIRKFYYESIFYIRQFSDTNNF